MKEGDVVRLRSGGPYMTLLVRETDGTPTWRCGWFSLAGEDRAATYPAHALITYDEATGAAPPENEESFTDEEAPPAPVQTWKQKRGLT